MVEQRPMNCRFRLRDEGKMYPRSSCQACGKTIATGLGNICSQVPTYADLEAEILSLRQQLETARAEGREAGLEKAATALEARKTVFMRDAAAVVRALKSGER